MGDTQGLWQLLFFCQKDFQFNNQLRYTGHQLGISPANTQVISGKMIATHSPLPFTTATPGNLWYSPP